MSYALDTNASPFDAIKKTDDQGREYWSARELMPLLGYPAWREFKPAIERAKATAKNQGESVDIVFGVNPNNPSDKGGRPAEDYKLARHAAYLVVMNGDPRKPEVAAAQAYFAIKTREAEVEQAKPFDDFDLMHNMIDQIKANKKATEQADRKAREAEIKALRSEVEAAKANARLDGIEGRHDWFSALGYARHNNHADTSTRALQRLGRRARIVAKRNNVEPDRVQHAHYGDVNSFPLWVWDVASNEMAEGDAL